MVDCKVMSLHCVGMRVLTVRNIPDSLYDLLTDLARKNRRSLQQQALVLLEGARVHDVESPCDRARTIRSRLEGRALGDTVREIREDRDR